MGILSIIIVILSCSTVALCSKDINVLDYGAVGDGCTDDSNAFSKAWSVACYSTSAGCPTMIIPEGRTFLVNPTSFIGPCKPKDIKVQILGTITSPESIKTWDGIDSSQWLVFRDVSGLTVDGDGTIHGRGRKWWSQSCRYNPRKDCTVRAPTAIKFDSCHNSYLSNLHFVDSANTHVAVKNTNWFYITNVKISSPKTSPNTDGIHIERSKHIFIDHSNIKSGDDCISIGDHTSHIRITDVSCGPGHGISVGSLGRGGTKVEVEDIHVSHASFYQTTNGVRIKTWAGATGYARDITFEHLNFTAVQNPIIIDQYYCNNLFPGECRAVEKSDEGVQISGVTYKNAFGTSSTKVAISLTCSKAVACTDIVLDSIELTTTTHSHRHHHERATSSCFNARGRTKGVIQPNIPCLDQE